jgi:hypothetical protein
VTDEDMKLVDAIRTPGTPEHEEMAAILPGLTERTPTSTVLAAILHLGAKKVTEKAVETGYAALAASLDDEDNAFYAAARERRNQRLQGAE